MVAPVLLQSCPTPQLYCRTAALLHCYTAATFQGVASLRCSRAALWWLLPCCHAAKLPSPSTELPHCCTAIQLQLFRVLIACAADLLRYGGSCPAAKLPYPSTVLPHCCTAALLYSCNFPGCCFAALLTCCAMVAPALLSCCKAAQPLNRTTTLLHCYTAATFQVVALQRSLRAALWWLLPCRPAAKLPCPSTELPLC
eukprot:gene29426-biopygen5350